VINLFQYDKMRVLSPATDWPRASKSRLKIFESTTPPGRDCLFVMGSVKGRRKGAQEKPPAQKGRSVIACALCGEVIKSTQDAIGDGVVIYSICPACKLVPPRRSR
jgi:hypothetical protein